ncbi:uncharacterized protein LOC62_06G008565 [Vanrija pseudolonga]|uniref:UBA domain-containing protein n=1 Tax=Vanrija pseudolonga TaxID=143232 RepID=A0AAF1BQP0_9TREE|nr:hypothetical protein LOC62_06G008565 [Vanrija pseudolonga]
MARSIQPPLPLWAGDAHPTHPVQPLYLPSTPPSTPRGGHIASGRNSPLPSSPLTPLIARFQRLADAVATHIRPHLPANRAKVRHLVAMGFPHFEAVWAAKVVRGDVRMCAHFLLEHLEAGGTGDRYAGCEWCEARAARDAAASAGAGAVGARDASPAATAAAEAKAAEAEGSSRPTAGAGAGGLHARSFSLPTAFRGGIDLQREAEIDAHSQAERIASSWRRRPRVRARFAGMEPGAAGEGEAADGGVMPAPRHGHTHTLSDVTTALPGVLAGQPQPARPVPLRSVTAPASVPAAAAAAPPHRPTFTLNDSTDSIDQIGGTAGEQDTVCADDGWATVPGRKRYPWGLEL